MTLLSDNDLAGPLVLDTSALINLLGTEVPERILISLGTPCLIEDRVLGELTRHPVPGRCHIATIEQLCAIGLLSRHRMSDDEYEVYLELSARSGKVGLGVGESAAIAVGSRRRLTIVLDDRKARHVCNSRFMQSQVRSSLVLLLAAANRGAWPRNELVAALRCAQINAAMGVLKEERRLLQALTDSSASSVHPN